MGSIDSFFSLMKSLTLEDEKRLELLKEINSAPGSLINEQTSTGETYLMRACTVGGLKNRFSVFMAIVTNPHVKHLAADRMGDTALHVACGLGLSREIFQLLGHQAHSVNQQNVIGSTPFMRAIKRGHLTAVKLMLASPWVDPNIPEKDGIPPLLFACEAFRNSVDEADVETSKELLHALLKSPKVDVNVRHGLTGMTPLHIMIQGKMLDEVDLMCSRPEVDVNLVVSGQSALHLALGDIQMVQRLLECQQLRVNERNEAGDTPVIAAAKMAADPDGDQEFDFQLIDLLHHPSVNVNARSGDGQTLLQCVMLSDDDAPLLVLLENPKLNLEDTPDKALLDGLGERMVDIVKLVLARHTVFDMADFDLYSLLSDALTQAYQNRDYEAHKVIDDYIRDPSGTRTSLRREFGYAHMDAAELFAQIIFQCEGLVALKKEAMIE